MQPHSNRTYLRPSTSAAKPQAHAESSAFDKPASAVAAHNDSMSTGTRTVGRSNVSQSGSVVSCSQHVNVPFDDGSLQHQRLEIFERQHVSNDGNTYARFQDNANNNTANREEAARICFHQDRAAEAIRQFNNTFNATKK